MMSRLLAAIALALCMLATAGIAQALVAYFLPSIAVAFVDVRVFRTWAGLGIREAAVQAVFLACFFVMMHPARFEAAAYARLVSSKLAVIGMIWLCVWLAIRLPAAVIGFWLVLTTLQVLVGAGAHRFLFSKPAPSAMNATLLRKTAMLGFSSIVVLSVVIGFAYSFPTPRPSYSFEIEPGDAQPVTIDAFIPTSIDEKKLPAVVIFHGVEGATPLSRLAIHYPNAQAISKNGIATFFVRYFDASPNDHLKIMKGSDTVDEEAIERILPEYERWVDIACHAIKEIRKQLGVDPDRIAVIGYSLGCYVGTAATSQLCEDGYPCAVVGNFGAISSEVKINSSFPPIQFYHGADDCVVRLEEVQKAKRRLQESGVRDVELFVYPKQGHVPRGPSSYHIRQSTERFLREQFTSDDDE